MNLEMTVVIIACVAFVKYYWQLLENTIELNLFTSHKFHFISFQAIKKGKARALSSPALQSSKLSSVLL